MNRNYINGVSIYIIVIRGELACIHYLHLLIYRLSPLAVD